MEFILENKLRVTDSPTPEAWQSFVLAHPEGTIFQCPGFARLCNSIKCMSSEVLAAQDEKGDIKGVLVYTVMEEEGRKSKFSKRTIINGGPLATGNDPDIIRILLKAYEKKTRGLNVIYTEIRNHCDTSSVKDVFEQHGYSFTDHLNIYIDLSKAEEELQQDVHKKRMSNIRRAGRKGVCSREIKTQEEIAIAYNLIRKTYQRVNLPLPSAELFLKAGYYLNESVKIYGAFNEGKMIGARVYLLFKSTVYDWYAGSDEEYFNLHPNDILPWDMICLGKKAGYLTYDFGGAGQPGVPYGVRVYKQRFGGYIVNRGRYTKIHRPLLYKLGCFAIKYYKFFKRL